MSKPSPKPRKKVTVGERIARSMVYADDSYITAYVAKHELPKAIDAAIRRAVREAFSAGINGHSTEWLEIETRYGVKL